MGVCVCVRKRTCGHTQASGLHGLQIKDHVSTQGRSCHFQAKQRGLEMVGETNLARSFILDFSFQDCANVMSVAHVTRSARSRCGSPEDARRRSVSELAPLARYPARSLSKPPLGGVAAPLRRQTWVPRTIPPRPGAHVPLNSSLAAWPPGPGRGSPGGMARARRGSTGPQISASGICSLALPARCRRY